MAITRPKEGRRVRGEHRMCYRKDPSSTIQRLPVPRGCGAAPGTLQELNRRYTPAANENTKRSSKSIAQRFSQDVWPRSHPKTPSRIYPSVPGLAATLSLQVSPARGVSRSGALISRCRTNRSNETLGVPTKPGSLPTKHEREKPYTVWCDQTLS